MNLIRSTALALLACGIAAAPAAANEKRELSYSFNVAVASDYVFRGFTQTAGAPTGQAGLDVTWGKFYAGMWASGIDFGPSLSGKDAARAEVDFYAGFKPEWMGINFDFGVIYYAYPGARDNGGSVTLPGEANYVELKAGMSRGLWKDGTLSSTYFYSPDYTNSTGRVITAETTFSQVLPVIAGWTPTFSATYGSQWGKSASYIALVGNGEKKYAYWNAGVAFGWEKFSIDLRYWDTNIKDDALGANFCTSKVLECDQRFVGTIKFTY